MEERVQPMKVLGRVVMGGLAGVLLYVMSVGPALFLIERFPSIQKSAAVPILNGIYNPLFEVMPQDGICERAMNSYLGFWAKLGAPTDKE